ncbi:unnamed protein product [Calicophoron daubneyi]|uniref:CRAL-TRIO domain-containing protein n=1 Tax=Calicophoron daubneyi TaxID=300641 RepID=A0AAV2TUD0_CALDB
MMQQILGYDQLTEEVKKKAKEELHENPEQVEAHLISFRRWVSSLPHIKFPLDDQLLLPFLRHAKYIHAKAQKRLDNFCTVRKSTVNGFPHLFKDLPPDDPGLEAYFTSGATALLGYTTDGCIMYLIRLTPWLDDENVNEVVRTISLIEMDRIILDPRVQITGQGAVVDMTQWSGKLFLKEAKAYTKISQEGFPLRMKRVIYLNPPKMFEIVLKLFQPWISEKLRRRVIIVRGDMDKVYESIPGLKEIMPAEYGGGNDTVENLALKWSHVFREFVSKPSPWKDVEVDESKRPESAKNLMKEYADIDLSKLGTKGTYVQLDQD